MGRELRRVPADWEHPQNRNGDFIPLFDDDYETAIQEWIRDGERFILGRSVEYGPDDESYPRTWTGYARWFGDADAVENFRPAWTDEERTHFQVYENVSEGTPVSPVLESKEAVIEWWMNVGDSFSGRLTREQAERWVGYGSSPSMAIIDNTLIPGAQL